MGWRHLLLSAQFAILQTTLAYEVTRYFVNSTSAYLTITETDHTTTRLRTSTFEVELPPGEATPTPLSVSTSIDAFVTAVTVWVPFGVGNEIPQLDVMDQPQYYVTVTFDRCFLRDGSHQTGFISHTVTQTLYLPSVVTGHMSPTATYGTMELIAPSDLHPIDFAEASYFAVPSESASTVCSRATTQVDYRSYCSTWILPNRTTVSTLPATTATTTKNPTLEEISCGELNPCCWGCHEWGSGPFGIVDKASFYICEDGRELELDGTESNRSDSWDIIDSEKKNDLSMRGVAVSGALIMTLLALIAVL